MCATWTPPAVGKHGSSWCGSGSLDLSGFAPFGTVSPNVRCGAGRLETPLGGHELAGRETCPRGGGLHPCRDSWNLNYPSGSSLLGCESSPPSSAFIQSALSGNASLFRSGASANLSHVHSSSLQARMPFTSLSESMALKFLSVTTRGGTCGCGISWNPCSFHCSRNLVAQGRRYGRSRKVSAQRTETSRVVLRPLDSGANFRIEWSRRARLVGRIDQQCLEAPFRYRWRFSRIARNSMVDELSGSDIGEASSVDVESKQSPIGVFPGGVRRAEVRIPGLVLRVQVLEVLEGKGLEGFLEVLSSVVAEGLTMVIVESGMEGEGGARLYEAACALKSVLRGRAELLVAERVDIAAAAGADGVVLSDGGLPTVVARRMMQNAVSEAAVLPLVVRTVSSTQSAKTATALEGADLLLLKCSAIEDHGNYISSVCREVSIPVFLDVSTLQLSSKDLERTLGMLQAGASGLVLNARDLIHREDVAGYMASVSSAVNLALKQQGNTTRFQTGEDYSQASSIQGVQDGSFPVIEKEPEVPLDLETQAKLIVEEERKLLTTMVDFVQAASPEMEEISLLVDSVKQLDELFLLVIVGEFNSGKSSLINALLGKRFLKDGVLPTTNEITVLRHSEEGLDGDERSERHPDGHFLRYLPAELLKQMNLVDTPGTNVILQRQQRLTEEFVPRADLVLFVLSVDRPLTESEVTFLRYIRQWGKKIIFILNKSDVLSDPTELEEVMSFVKENAQTLLGVEKASVYPVSARRALLAKQAAFGEDGVIDTELLLQDSFWKSSGFEELEEFIFSFLGGSTDAGAERLRLKLETPLGIATALLGASDRQLSADIVKAESDLRILAQIDEQLSQYQQAIQADAAFQRQRTMMVITAAKGRAGKFVDSVLRLSNIEAIFKYLLGTDATRGMPVSSGFSKQVVDSADSDIQKVLQEHGTWLMSNTVRQLDMYGELVRSRWPDVIPYSKSGIANGLQVSDKFKEEKQRNVSNSIAVLNGFDIKAAELLLDQEIREVVLGTFTGLGAAGVSASVLTSILPTTLEDLVALGVCTAGGFVGVWNLPSRRQDVKKKVNRVADSLARQLEEAMERDLQQNVEQLRADIQSLTAPYRVAAELERARIVGLQSQLEALDNELRSLRQKVQNLGT